MVLGKKPQGTGGVPLLARLRRRLKRLVLSRSGILARVLLHPDPWRHPRRLATIDLARDAGIGDVIMCTPALRALKAANPAGRIRFYTNFPDIVRGLPYIDDVLPYDTRPPGTIFLEYTDVVPSRVHIARLLGDRVGVAVPDTAPDCIVDHDLVGAYKSAWAGQPRPWVIALRRASRFTPNKDWPDDSWNDLIERVCARGTIIETGFYHHADGFVPPRNHVDLRGKTSITQLVAAIAAADVYVGPVSGPMHIAAAVKTPSVAIIGGYEHPDNAHYAGNREFYTPVPCAPCWLREPCPYDLKCLRAIRPDLVAREVFEVSRREGLLF